MSKTKAANAAPEKTTAVEVARPGELAPAPDFLPKSREGTEGMAPGDLVFPQLRIAQALSPQMKKADAKYMEDLEEGQLFNDLTGEIYGNGPLKFAVVRRDPPKWIEFDPNQRGVVKDFNVPAGDPRCEYTEGPDGQSVKPKATQFYDYIVMMLPLRNQDPMTQIAVLSMKGANVSRKGAARRLNTLINGRERPVWSGTYELGSAMQTNAKGTFGVYTVKNDGWVDAETMVAMRAVFKAVKDKDIKIEREPGSDDGDDLAGDI